MRVESRDDPAGAAPVAVPFSCPVDTLELGASDGGLACSRGHRYGRGADGYYELAAPGSAAYEVASTSAHGAEYQDRAGGEMHERYLGPLLGDWGARRVLDAGCGVGLGVERLRSSGLDAVGLDVRSVAGLWRRREQDRDAFVVGDVMALPFPTGSFDAVVSLGVVEHIGTVTGHCTLGPGWWEARRRFAGELVRVTRPGGHVVIAGPNKWFPLDVQHGPNDELTSAVWRSRVFGRIGINVHPTWGAYHLPSWRDVRKWFGPLEVEPLPLRGYFGFQVLGRPEMPSLAGRAARAWVEHLPARLRATPLNPYVLAAVEV